MRLKKIVRSSLSFVNNFLSSSRHLSLRLILFFSAISLFHLYCTYVPTLFLLNFDPLIAYTLDHMRSFCVSLITLFFSYLIAWNLWQLFPVPFFSLLRLQTLSTDLLSLAFSRVLHIDAAVKHRQHAKPSIPIVRPSCFALIFVHYGHTDWRKDGQEFQAKWRVKLCFARLTQLIKLKLDRSLDLLEMIKSLSQ